MIEAIAEAAPDEDKRTEAKLMLAVSRTSEKISTLMLFAAPSNTKSDKLTEERKIVIDFIEHISAELDSFIEAHPAPTDRFE